MVCIKDHNGKLSEQRIEYEWRTKFCQTCLKIRHNCDLKKHSGKKIQPDMIWKPVASKNTKTQLEGEVSKNSIEEELSKVKRGDLELENNAMDTWTTVTSGRMDKGKKAMIQTLKSSFVAYQKSFTPLRIGEGSMGDNNFDQ
ncbi:unnamed protein product [Lathyrus sativus]|nr:unnamed protein product [Lathyrus sativus]